MNLKTILLSCFILLAANSLFAQDENDVLGYIQRYKELAINEQLRSGVPAAITLAQGIHESSAGKSELATKANNHFGIKCKSTWTGQTILHDDDAKQECFRKYTSAEQSYIDHSDFLKASNRYHFLFDLDRTDYAGWASGLKRAGYATNPQYVKRLTDLVEKYNLQQYTFEAITKANTPSGEIVPLDDKPRNLTQIDDPSTYYKGLKGFWAKKGETLLPKALEKNIRYARLLAMNDLGDEPLPSDMFIFTEKKRRVGTEEFHVVKEGETMLLIAQKEAMPLATLYLFNNLSTGQQPEVGEKLTLQYKSYDKPKIKEQFLNAFDQKNEASPTIVKAEPVHTEPVITKESPAIETTTQQEITHEAEPIASRVEETQKTIETNQGQTPVLEESTTAVKETTQQSEEIAKTETVVEQNVPTVVNNSGNDGILDAEKARHMEELLNSQPLDKQTEVTRSQQDVKQEQSPFTGRNEVVKEQSVTEAPAAIAIPEPPVVKRTYNEPGVDDSTKVLKKKFDLYVYSPRPPRKPDTSRKVEPVVQKVIPEVKKPEPKPSPVKKDEKKTAAKKVVEKAGNKDAKKPVAEKENSKKDKDLQKTAGNKKLTPAEKKKAEADKKKAELAQKGKDKKETAADKKKAGKGDKKTDKKEVKSPAKKKK